MWPDLTRASDAAMELLYNVMTEAEKREKKARLEKYLASMRDVAQRERIEAQRWLRQNVNEHRKALGLPSLIQESITEFRREMDRMGQAAQQAAESWHKMTTQINRDLS